MRIDDQALVPADLLSEDEMKYQTYFMQRYPDISRIVSEKKYLNSTWLTSPEKDTVGVDDLFHFSHCVLAIKRYFTAKRTGRHICGRDIDEEHVRHCVDSLEYWAFPGGRVGGVRENEGRPLWWRGKVCFE